jgi:RNA polymerase sigma-B factor
LDVTGPISASLRVPSVGPYPTGKPDWETRSDSLDPSKRGPTNAGPPTIDSHNRESADELMLLAHYRETRCTIDLDRIVQSYQGLVQSLAFRFKGRGAELDDLVQAAQIGLLLAIDRFDLERGVPFVAFAIPTILGELRKYFRTVWSVHLPRSLQESTQLLGIATNELLQEPGRSPSPEELADRTGIASSQIRYVIAAAGAFRSRSLDAPIVTRTGESLSQYEAIPALDASCAFEAVEAKQLAERLLESLPSRSRKIVELRFYQNRSQSEIAEVVGLSQMQVSRLLRQAMQLMSSTSFDDTAQEETMGIAA